MPICVIRFFSDFCVNWEKSITFASENQIMREIMNAMNVQVLNPNVFPLLQSLESMNLIRIKYEVGNTEEADFLRDLKSSAEDVRLHKQGKLKLKTAQDLLNEL
jgi:hypothetical protein